MRPCDGCDKKIVSTDRCTNFLKMSANARIAGCACIVEWHDLERKEQCFYALSLSLYVLRFERTEQEFCFHDAGYLEQARIALAKHVEYGR